MTLCDPPYNVDYANTPKDKLRGKNRPILNDNLGSGFEAFLLEACTNILSVTKGACYICMSSSELHTLQRAFTAAGGKWSTFVIWAKPSTPSRSAGPTTSGNMSPSCAAARMAATTTGAVHATRATSGSSTSR
jgi:DNA modification methylase